MTRYVSAAALEAFVTKLLCALGAPKHKAKLVATSLVSANLRGVDSHGVHLLPEYAKHFRNGNIRPEADGHVISESGACLLYDGEHGIGQWISYVCCQHAVRLARQYGLGMVVARNSNHFGAAAFWGQTISAHGMIAIVMCNASPSVPPWQGREGRIGTNPICVAVPSQGSGAWLLDMATTTVAMNKIRQAYANGQKTIPYGWAMDRDGVPTTSVEEAIRGWLMPLGGYKGSGLGMMVEILCAVLSGGPMATAVGGIYHLDRKMGTSQTFIAIDVQRFLPLDEFQRRMEHLIRVVKSAPVAKGYSEILVAGDPEARAEQLRRQSGIPIDEATWDRLARLAQELGVAMLEPQMLRNGSMSC